MDKNGGLDGQLDEFAIYDRVLEPTEVIEHYASANDSSFIE